MLKRLLIAALAGLLIGAPLHAQLMMTGVGQPTNGPGPTFISQCDYTLGAFCDSESDTRSTTATYYNSSGNIASAAINIARFDYTGGSAQGWLVEAAATNATFPSVVATPSWISGSFATVTNNAATAPDASSAAAFVVPKSTGGEFVTYASTTISGSGTDLFGTIFAAAGTYNYAYVYVVSNDGVHRKGATFNLTTGAVTQNTANTGATGSASATLAGTYGGKAFYQLSVHLTNNASGSSGFIAFIAAPTGTVTFSASYLYSTSAGDGTSGAYAWGAQMINAAYTGSYIPTTTAGVTRAADTAAGSNWWNGSSGNYLMVESTLESTGVTSRASYCASGCTSASAFAPSGVWIKRICRFSATPGGATKAQTNAANANGTVCS